VNKDSQKWHKHHCTLYHSVDDRLHTCGMTRAHVAKNCTAQISRQINRRQGRSQLVKKWEISYCRCRWSAVSSDILVLEFVLVLVLYIFRNFDIVEVTVSVLTLV